MSLSTFDTLKRVRPTDAVALDASSLCALQGKLVDIVREMLAFCGENGIVCLLAGGTALGARRDGRFIPWDDDVDLLMPRADYERFLILFSATLGSRYCLQAPGLTREHSLASARVRLRGTSVRTREDVCSGVEECGAFVDIFIIENTFDNGLLRAFHGGGSMALGLLYACRKFFSERRVLRGCAEADRRFRRVYRLKAGIGCLLSFLPLRVWVRLWDRWNALCPDGNSQRVTVPVGRGHFWGEMGMRAELCQPRPIAFEGLEAFVPAGVDAYLSRLYGSDFLTPPATADRESHVFYRPFVLTGGSA